MEPATVTVLTATIPGRGDLFAENRASVQAQTIPCEHLYRIDVQREGIAVMLNRLAARVETPWLFLLDDDDLMAPDCLELHLAWSEEADVVYSRPDVDGFEDWAPWHDNPPRLPSNCLILTEFWRRMGGRNERLPRPPRGMQETSDREWHTRALAAGGRFRLCPIPHLWTYRPAATRA